MRKKGSLESLVTASGSAAKENDNFLDNETKRLQFPRYKGLVGMDLVARDLLLSSVDAIAHLNPKMRSSLLLLPPLYHEGMGELDIDHYLFASMVRLSSAILSTKNMYRRNDLSFNEESFLPDDVLNSLMPPLEEKHLLDVSVKTTDSASKIREHALLAAEKLIEGIETQFYHIKDYDLRHATSGEVNAVMRRAKEMNKYADLASRLGSAISDLGYIHDGGSIKAVMELFKNESLSEDLIKEHDEPYRDSILRLHSQVRGLPFNGFSYTFSSMIGEEIGTVMDVALAISSAFRVSSEASIAGKDRLLTPEGENFYLIEQGTKIRDEWNKDWVGCLSALLLENENLSRVLQCRKAPFESLDEKLHAFGVPFRLASKVSEYLSVNITDRSIPGVDASIDSKEAMHLALHTRKDYASALKKSIEDLTGKKPNDISYKFFGEDDNHLLASGISPRVYLAIFRDGKIIHRERDSKLMPQAALTDAVRQFRAEEADIYVRKNSGVCFTFGFDGMSCILNPSFSFIEARDVDSEVEKIDPMGAKLSRLHVDLHETVHAAQVGSRLMWRSVGASVIEHLSSVAITQLKHNRLDREVPTSNLGQYKSKQMTWRDLILEVIDEFGAQALGRGTLASNARQMGLYHALWEAKGISCDDPALFGRTVRSIPRESSITADYYREARRILAKSSDIEEIETLEMRVRDYSDELVQIVETMAEAFSSAALMDHIENLPDARYSKEKRDRYFDSIYSSLVRRGTLAQKFIDIAKSSPSRKELQRRLSKEGMFYHPALSREMDEVVDKNLMLLGYDPIDLYEAYDDVEHLRSLASANGKRMSEVLLPMNHAKANLGVRYSTHIPLFMDVIGKYGPKKAFKKLLFVESLSEVKDLLLPREPAGDNDE